MLNKEFPYNVSEWAKVGKERKVIGIIFKKEIREEIISEVEEIVNKIIIKDYSKKG